MIGARHALVLLLVLLPVACESGTAVSSADSGWDWTPPTADVAASVDPFIGTADATSLDPGAIAIIGGSGGGTFPGATVPFGMVQWSPDSSGALYPKRYLHTEHGTDGFAVTHFNGAGCPAFVDFPILPVTAPLTQSGKLAADTIDPADEHASPGFYRARLGSGIRAELTATTRTGLGRFTFPAGTTPRILISLASPVLTVASPASYLHFDAARGIVTGMHEGGGFCAHTSRYRVYFAAVFDRPVTEHGSWSDDVVTTGADHVTGENGGMYLALDPPPSRQVQMKLGLSYVSAENALANLQAESRGFDLAAVRSAARSRWNGLLSRIEIEGGAAHERRLFYTALYHALMQPNVFNDVNGEYAGFDGAVHRLAPGTTHYANFSGWDVYRSWVQLAALLAPEETSAMMESLVRDADQCGALPRWSMANDETGVMVGSPADPTLASAYAFGARGFDANGALGYMVAGATDPTRRCNAHLARPDLEHYTRLGYCTAGDGPPSTTLEYAIADDSIARLAAALGDTATRDVFAERGKSWLHVFNPETGYVQRRLEDGAWAPGFDPGQAEGFVEGNAAQYTFMVPHDTPALVERLGGDAAFIERLDHLFQKLNAGESLPHFYMGNEPQFGTPWAYGYAGAAWKTQRTVRRVMTELFHAEPAGLPGNDDLGATSSWYVWAALGLYPYTPGLAELRLHGPLFPRALVHLAGGRTLEILGRDAGAANPYVQSLKLGDKEQTRTWASLDEVLAAGRLDFVMGPREQPAWGTR